MFAAPPSPPFAPKAVVFDMDGLLVDSEVLWGRAERRVVEGYGRAWEPEVQQLLLGSGPADAAALLARHLGVADADEVDRRLLAASVEEFRAGVPLRPGAGPLVAALRGRLPLAIASNSRRVLVDLALSSAGLCGVMDAVVSAEDVARPKPAPDPYAGACALLGVDPAAAVAFEDSPTGVVSARAAGCWVIGCPSLPGTRLDGAHATVAALTEVDAPALLRGAVRREGPSASPGCGEGARAPRRPAR